MHRRARIKVSANLSSVRRTISKCSPENSRESQEKLDVSENEQIKIKQEVEFEDVSQLMLSNSIDIDADLNNENGLINKLEEKSNDCDKEDQIFRDNGPSNLEAEREVPVNRKLFETSVLETSHGNNESSSSNSLKKSKKIAPRLNIVRTASKVQDVDEIPKVNEFIIENPVLSPVHNENVPEMTITAFFTPNTSISTPPRAEIPCDDLPYPQTAFQSPVASTSVQITESTCNSPPKKKLRVADQAIVERRRESLERLSNKNIEKSQLRMFDMLYFDPKTNPCKPRATSTPNEKPKKKIDLSMELPKEPSNAIAVPQLKLNENGELILDEKSLVVENEEQKENRMLLEKSKVVYHDDPSISYGFYKRRQRTKEWTHEETVKFYRCLNTVGTDFSLMLDLFPNRSRRDLALKFKKEEKNNLPLVDKALLKHNMFDFDELQKDFEEEDEMRQKEAEEKANELAKRKAAKKRKPTGQPRKSNVGKILSDGDAVLNAVNKASKRKFSAKRIRAPKRKIVEETKTNEDQIKDVKVQSSDIVMDAVVEQPALTAEPSNVPSIICLEPSYNPSVISVNSSILTKEQSCNALISTDSYVIPVKSAHSNEEKFENIQAEPVVPTDKPMEIDVEQSVLAAELPSDSSIITVDPSYDQSVISINSTILTTKQSCDPLQLGGSADVPMENVVEQRPESSKDPSIISVDSSYNQSAPTNMPMENIQQPILTVEPSYSVVSVTSDNISMLLTETSYNYLLQSVASSDVLMETAADPSLIFAEPSYDPSIIYVESFDQSSYNISAEHSYSTMPIVMQEDISNYPIVWSVQEAGNTATNYASIAPIEPVVSGACAQETVTPVTFYDENFLNSLNLERLVIVVKQVDGKDFYEIYETDENSEELPDKPLDLPQHIIDLIVSAMAQDE